jgi:hypothetical protein
MNTINRWFADGRDFWEGVSLLQQAGREVKVFEPYLSEGFVPTYFRELLESQLLGCNFDEFSEKSEILQPSPPLNKPSQNVDNQAISELKSEAKNLHKRHADRHAQLHFLQTDAQRLPVIIEIMNEIIPALDDTYEAIRNGGVRKNKLNTEGSESGEKSQDFKQGIAEGLKIAAQIAYLKNRIFKLESANGLIAKATSVAEKAKFQAELTQKRNELIELTKHIT